MDDVEIRLVVLERDALRRESGLPSLDIEKEVKAARDIADGKAAWERYERLRELHANHYASIRNEIIAEERASGNVTFPIGWSDRYYLRTIVEKRFKEFLKQIDSSMSMPADR